MKPFTPKYTITDIQEMAAFNGGRCLSKEYWDINTKLAWQCEKGHTFDITPLYIERGYWCPQCAKAERQSFFFEELQQIAKKRGGKCLSEKYIDCYTKLKWQCKEGHTWDTTLRYIKRGYWCPQCAKAEKQSFLFEDLQQIAQSKGGKCLSDQYINKKNKLIWQCKKGHTFETTRLSVMQGHWCIQCAKTKREIFLFEELLQIARSNRGRCLSKEYLGFNTKLAWQCEKGHTFDTAPQYIKQGNWCPLCAKAERQRFLFEELLPIAQSKGGKCLSRKYINENTKLKWKCKEGHIWEAIATSIKRGHWCPVCAVKTRVDKQIGTIEQMQKIAENSGGRCLSDQYISSASRLTWQCESGHTWNASPDKIKTDSWCPHCKEEKRRKSELEKIQQIAKSRGGKCLSSEYINGSTKLRWQCKEGHTWKAVTPNVKHNNTWCPVCAVKKGADKRRDNIEEMRKIAKNKGGKCLSKKYIISHTKLKWQCKEGHVWETAPYCIKSGKWCPYCAKNRRLIIKIENYR